MTSWYAKAALKRVNEDMEIILVIFSVLTLYRLSKVFFYESIIYIVFYIMTEMKLYNTLKCLYNTTIWCFYDECFGHYTCYFSYNALNTIVE